MGKPLVGEVVVLPFPQTNLQSGDNVFATQFHPKKSQKVGLQLLKNFVELAK